MVRFKQVKGILFPGVPRDQLPGSMKEIGEKRLPEKAKYDPLIEYNQIRLIGYWRECIDKRNRSDTRGKDDEGYVIQAVYQYQGNRYTLEFWREKNEVQAMMQLKELSAVHDVPIGDRIVFWGLGHIQWSIQEADHPIIKVFDNQHAFFHPFNTERKLWIGKKLSPK